METTAHVHHPVHVKVSGACVTVHGSVAKRMWFCLPMSAVLLPLALVDWVVTFVGEKCSMDWDLHCGEELWSDNS